MTLWNSILVFSVFAFSAYAESSNPFAGRWLLKGALHTYIAELKINSKGEITCGVDATSFLRRIRP
jgi:hypothetical protein